jgi:hypothetical protein
MDKKTNPEKEFGNDVDRLIAGKQFKAGGTSEENYEKTVEFAGMMLESRVEPSPAFKENLRRRLLLKLAEQEMEAQRKAEGARSLWEAVKHMVHRNPVWRTVAATVSVVVIALVIVWRAGVFPVQTSQPVLGTPAPTSGTTQGPVEVKSTASQTSYKLGEQVSVSITFENKSGEPLTLTPFPPEVIIAATSLRPYKTIPGGGSRTLLPGEVAEYVITWNQRDNEGQQVPLGNYVIEMLDIGLNDSRGIVSLSDSPRITIMAP